MTTNYTRGVRLEREVMNADRAKGYISARSAGSHSCVDVWTVDTKGRVIWLWQCKVGRARGRPEILDIPEGLYWVNVGVVRKEKK